MRIISCRTALGSGGLGQHFAQLVEESRESGELLRYYAHTVAPGDDGIGCIIDRVRVGSFARFTPLRYFPRRVAYMGENIFDRRVARSMHEKADSFMGFVGKSLYSFRRAKALGTRRLELVAANSHVNNILRRHRLAAEQHGIDDSWMGRALAAKTRSEYEAADIILVHSDYTRQSLVEEGVPERKLHRTYLHVDNRFRPSCRQLEDGVTRIAYVGRVDVTKGIPLLREVMSRIDSQDVELTIVGGWSSRTMRKYMRRWLEEDPRVKMAPGDPLPILQKTDIYVHPSYEDGLAYSPLEALACGVPVIVTEDTGMKEFVREGQNGFVVPTGDWSAILDRIQYLMSYPLTVPTSSTARCGSS